MSKKRGVLGDHQKVGKRFVPPLLQRISMTDTPWIARILPELIWLGALVDRCGPEKGISLGSAIAEAARSANGSEKMESPDFVFLSSYAGIDKDAKNSILDSLESKGLLIEIQSSLSPLFILYPECPLSFIGGETELGVDWIKDLIGRLSDRTGQPAMMIQACVPHFAGQAGKLVYSKDVEPPNLEAIAFRFGSEEEERASGQVRAHVNAVVGFQLEHMTSDWPQYFWNRGLQLEPVSAGSCISMAEEEEGSVTEHLPAGIRGYLRNLRESLDERWQRLPKDAYASETTEVITALLARQVSIARRIARNPDIWDWHVGPVLLRTMVDTHISLAWVLDNPGERARRFIRFGLGQAKLTSEHLKASDRSRDEDVKAIIDAETEWINSQRYTFLLEVDVGSLSGTSTREMAKSVGLEDLYNFAYSPWSSATHSMWNHVGRINLAPGCNPLHRYLRAPIDPECSPQIDILVNSARYLALSLEAIDAQFDIKCVTSYPDEFLYQALEEAASMASEHHRRGDHRERNSTDP